MTFFLFINGFVAIDTLSPHRVPVRIASKWSVASVWVEKLNADSWMLTAPHMHFCVFHLNSPDTFQIFMLLMRIAYHSFCDGHHEQFPMNSRAMKVFVIVLIMASLGFAHGEFIELFDNLNRALAYLVRTPDARTPDAMLGVYLCKGISVSLSQQWNNVVQV